MLPDAAWQHSSGLSRVIAALGAADMRIVGGAVRDTALGLHVTDIDIATKHLPHEVLSRLEAAGIKAIPTGIEHGTITAISDGDKYEITTLRRDVDTDGRRATIAFASDWQDDAARRDFTINALYADAETGEIFDYFQGLDDLKTGRVAFIGDAATRIAEDNLRILRFYRFAARFGTGNLDEASHAAVITARQSLKSLSRERICDELLKILSLPDPRPITLQMQADGIFDVLLPEADRLFPARLHLLVEAEQAAAITPDPLRRLAALLPADTAIVGQVASRLRLSKRQRGHLSAIAQHRDDASLTARQLAYHIGVEAARDVVLFRAESAQQLPSLTDWDVPEMPLKGGEIVARGLAKGPAVAELLKAVEADWIAEDFPDAARVQQLLDQKTGLSSERRQ
jgi:poly(A) polymerase